MANTGQIPWPSPGRSRDRHRADPMTAPGQFLRTSQIEKLFLAASQEIDPDADSATLNRWRVDVLMPSLGLVIEYDGEYWHARKHETDTRKTRELIAMGYQVARVRENDLPHLELESSRLRQVSFRPMLSRPDDVVQALSAWAERGD